MSKITKVPKIDNYRTTSPAQNSSVKRYDDFFRIQHKSDVHNTPERSSSNEDQLLDLFYEKSHLLKQLYLHITRDNNDEQTIHYYFKTHKQGIRTGAKALVEDINRLIQSSIQCDYEMNTHFYFWIESLILEKESQLLAIGIRFANKCLYLDTYTFYHALTHHYEHFIFLFEPQVGFMDQCARLNDKIKNMKVKHFTKGQYLDTLG